LKLGLYVCSQHPESDDPARRVAELVEQTRLAAELGFDSIWAGEHHVPAPFHYLPQLPLLARLAADADEMIVGTNLVLLPLWHPLHVAEQGAFLDVITGGRFVLGVGLGFRRVEFEALGVPFAERVGRMVEAIEVIDALWSNDEIDHRGRYFDLRGIGIRPRPLQRPRPPIWIGATVDRAVERAARLGDAWLMTSLPTMGDLAAQVEIYRRALDAAGRPFPVEFPRMLEVHVAADTETAHRRAAPGLTTKYAAYADWGQRELMPDGSGLDEPFDVLARDRFVLGDPTTVTDGLVRQHDELGITHIAMRVQWPGMTQDHALECIELLGREVLPRVRAATIDRVATAEGRV
jgi:probable F420-dependent oxidoreductase